MTKTIRKQDYELIAEAIRFSHQSLGNIQFDECYKGIERAADILADYLQADNPQFDRDKFLSDCGIETELQQIERKAKEKLNTDLQRQYGYKIKQ